MICQECGEQVQELRKRDHVLTLGIGLIYRVVKGGAYRHTAGLFPNDCKYMVLSNQNVTHDLPEVTNDRA